MRKIAHPETISYQALDSTLTSLGFTRTIVPQEGAVVYRHARTGAAVILGERQPSDKVDPLELNTARKTVLEKGVADAKQFAAAVRKARGGAVRRGRVRERLLTLRGRESTGAGRPGTASPQSIK